MMRRSTRQSSCPPRLCLYPWIRSENRRSFERIHSRNLERVTTRNPESAGGRQRQAGISTDAGAANKAWGCWAESIPLIPSGYATIGSFGLGNSTPAWASGWTASAAAISSTTSPAHRFSWSCRRDARHSAFPLRHRCGRAGRSLRS